MKTNTGLMTKLVLNTLAGLALAAAIFIMTDSSYITIGEQISQLAIDNVLLLYFLNFVVLLVPALLLTNKGKKAYITLMSDQDETNLDTEKKAGYLDLAMSFIGVYSVFQLVLFGTLYHHVKVPFTMLILVFLAGIMGAAALNVYIVKFVHSLDTRLKGDPSKMSFEKTLLDSLDEAEQLRVFKIGYQSFQTTKTATLIIMVISILMNILLGTGIFAIIFSGFMLLVETISFAYNERRTI